VPSPSTFDFAARTTKVAGMLRMPSVGRRSVFESAETRERPVYGFVTPKS